MSVPQPLWKSRLGGEHPPDLASGPIAAGVPVPLPHLELRSSEICFLGGPAGDLAADPAVLAALRECDGTRSWREYDPDAQKLLWRAQHRELLRTLLPAQASAGRAGLVIVSPHPDDAVLSLGACLHAADEPMILDVFSRETWTRIPHYRDKPDLTAKLLLEEERVACRLIGASAHFLGFEDAALRPRWSEGFLVDAAAGHESLGEDRLIESVADAILEHYEVSNGSRLLVPLGVGGHVDHLVCREGVLRLLGAGRLKVGDVAFYEDMPYTVFDDAAPSVSRIERALSEMGLSAEPMRRVMIDSAPLGADAKHQACRCYRLQVARGLVDRIMRKGWQNAPPGAGFGEGVWAFESVLI